VSVDARPLRLDSSTDGRTACIALTGELTYTTVRRFDEEVRRLVDASRPHLLLDVARLGFCDSAGLSALIAAHRLAAGHGGELGLRGVHGTLARALRVTGLTSVFTVHAAAEPDASADGTSVG
jgi:anti-sigma B factor antagonist